MEFQNEKYIIQNKKFIKETHISGACLQKSRKDRGLKKAPTNRKYVKKMNRASGPVGQYKKV